MSTLIVHGIPGSPFVRMPLLACIEKEAPFRLQAMGLADAKSPAHLARHPFGRIPFIEHDGFWLYETQAILRYIDQVFEGPSLIPSDAKAAARMQQVMNITDWYVAPSITNGIGWNRVVAPIFGLPIDEAAVGRAMPLGRTCISALQEILGSKPFFAGDQVTLADIMAFAHIDFMPKSPEGTELLAGSPLEDWLERMSARDSARPTATEKLMGLEKQAA
jgi:glutathione S-transferase